MYTLQKNSREKKKGKRKKKEKPKEKGKENERKREEGRPVARGKGRKVCSQGGRRRRATISHHDQLRAAAITAESVFAR